MSFLSVEKNTNISGKDLLKLWLELDSLYKVSDNLYSKGIINEKMGKPYNFVTLSRLIWNWVLENPDEALEITRASGKPVTDEYWEQILVNKAHSIYVNIYHSRPKFYTWLKKMELYDKYKDYRSARSKLYPKKVQEPLPDE